MRIGPVVALLVAFAGAGSAEGTKPPPPPPPAVVPDMKVTKPAALCISCDRPFDFPNHKEILEGLVSNPYVGELRKALYFQDTFHQFQSKAHFDNCDFDSSTEYLASLLEEIETHVADAQRAKSEGREPAFQEAVKRSFFTLGQALHSVQDFYAHTNFVEMQVPKVKKVQQLEIIAPWRKEGVERIRKLREEGLVSGYVFWGLPQKCPAGTPDHHDLAKDSAKTKSGKKLVPHLQNLSQHRIAVFMAREASVLLMQDAFRRWPLLKEVNGDHVAFEVLIDRRGL